MFELKLHVLQLENKKWFLHVSPRQYEEYLFLECSTIYDFVRNNPPVSVFSVIDITFSLDVNYHVKKYMKSYGIENVRGGNYTDEVLPEDVIKHLELEISTTFSDYTKDSDLFQQILQSYIYKLHISNNDFDFDGEIKRLNTDLENYNKEKKQYDFFKNKNGIEIDRTIISDIEWIIEKINTILPIEQNKVGIPYSNQEDIDRYKTFIKKYEVLYEKYYLLHEDKIRILPSVHLKTPNFILDNVFYHPRLINNWDVYLEDAVKFMEKIEFMAYTVINFIEELEFDVRQYNTNIENYTKYSIEIANTLSTYRQ
jgi:hypothetical protein